MSSTITGLGSGFDISGWISQLVSAKQASTVTPLKTKLSTLETKNSAVSKLESKFSTLQSALKSFTDVVYDSSSDMWTNTKIESSNSAYATAISSGNVSAASVKLEIAQIATSTIAKSISSLGATDKTSIENAKFTDLANGQAKAGSFSMFLNGKEYDIEIENSDTISDVQEKIYQASDGLIQAEVGTDGKFSIKAFSKSQNDEGENVYTEDTTGELFLGSSADESNLVAALKMHTTIGTHGYQSKYALSTVNTGIAMADTASGLSDIDFFDEEGNPAESGTITVNGVDFTIDKTTTLNNLISRINGNSETHVKASYDSLTNKLILTSTETGANNISLSENGTNLLNILGLTTGTGENEVIAKDSQKLGNNAIVTINGNDVISASNTITGESSGIAGLSITVKKPTSGATQNPEDDENVVLDIEPDYTKVKSALNSFVDAYNDLMSTAKTLTASDGSLSHDSSLNSIISKLRGITSQVSSNDGMFSMLSEIGISTSATDTLKLTIDNNKLDKSLSENFDSVKFLLSDGFMSKKDNGLFDNILTTVNSALDKTGGYFVNKSESIDKQIESINTSIERANTRLTAYETRITKQFNAMDSTLSALNTQLSTFMAYMG